MGLPSITEAARREHLAPYHPLLLSPHFQLMGSLMLLFPLTGKYATVSSDWARQFPCTHANIKGKAISLLGVWRHLHFSIMSKQQQG